MGNTPVKNLIIRAGGDFSALKKEMDKTQAQVSEFRNGITLGFKKIAAIVGGLGIGAAFVSGTNDAIRFEALMGTIGETLGSSSKAFKEWQNTTGAAMGFSKLQAAEMGNTFSLQFKSIAKDQKDLEQKTVKMMEALAIIQSKKGFGTAEIMDRMRSAMNQEADGADELGINVRASAIQGSKAFKEMAGNYKTWADITAAGNTQLQQMILQQYILDTVTDKYGTTIAKNTSLLKNQFVAAAKDAKLAMGQMFLPVLNIALPALTQLMRAAERAFQWVAALMRAIFPKADIAANNGAAAAVDNAAASVGGLADNQKDAAAATDKTNKALKEAAKSVAGFDEVTTLSSANAADTPDLGAAGGSVGGLGDFGKTDASQFDDVAESVKKAAEKIRKAIADLANDPKVKQLISAVKDLKESFKMLKDSLVEFWNTPAVQKIAGWVTDVLANSFLDARIRDAEQLSGILKGWSGAVDMFTALLKLDFPGLIDGFNKWKDGVTQTMTSLIDFFFPGLRKRFDAIWDGMTDAAKFVWGKYEDYIKWIWGEIEKIPVVEKFLHIWDDLAGDAKTKWGNVWTKISEAWDLIKQIKWSDVRTAISLMWSDVTTDAGEKLKEVRTAVSVGWAMLKDISWSDVRGYISQQWTDIKSDVAGKFEGIRTEVAEKWAIVAGIDFSGPRKAILNIWEDTKKQTGVIFTAMGEVVKNGVNNLIDMVNGLIHKLNGLGSINLPKALGGGTLGFDIPDIPHLKNGGITNGEMLAVVGDNPGGKEVVSPLDDLMGMMGAAVTNAMAAQQQFNGGSSTQLPDVVLQVDGVTFARITNPYAAKETTRIGGSMITAR